MVFCCIALVALAIMYFHFLWLRQWLSGPPRDAHSPLPAPPRALSGHGAWPVYGHTHLFARWAGDAALLFPATWRECIRLPATWTRPLGQCFAMFIWGQWRVVIKGPEAAQRFLASPNLKEGWPWTPPEKLLGKSCLAFLPPEQGQVLSQLLARPLSHEVLLQHAPVMAELAEKCLQDIKGGVFKRSNKKGGAYPLRRATRLDAGVQDADDDSLPGECPTSSCSHHRRGSSASFSPGPHSQRSTTSSPLEHVAFKVKWDALRSYTLDLLDGPLLNMNHWIKVPEQAHGESSQETPPRDTEASSGIMRDVKSTSPSRARRFWGGRYPKKIKIPTRDRMLLYMERMKAGLDVIKITFGPEWMYIWYTNEYGRALHARLHVEALLSRQVAAGAARAPVIHHRGHAFHEPSTQPIPLWTMRDNLLRSKEGIFGETTTHTSGWGHHEAAALPPHRPRSKSFPSDQWWDDDGSVEEEGRAQEGPVVTTAASMSGIERGHPAAASGSAALTAQANSNCAYILPFTMEQDLARPKYEQAAAASFRRNRSAEEAEDPNDDHQGFGDGESRTASSLVPPPQAPESPTRQRFRRELERPVLPPPPLITPLPRPTTQRRPELISLLDDLLRQQDTDGHGISQVVLTDLCIIFWMMLDVGNAWTAMALHLCATCREACALVQEEIDVLEMEFGRNELFSPEVLGKMKCLDALVYEAIRLSPPFLGGLKVTSETIELKELGVQVGKGSNIFFCQPTEGNFDIHQAVGKRPEELGQRYPCVELYGFLPLRGLEVPLMVLQSKVFLIVLLQQFDPSLSRRRTFIRRVTGRVSSAVWKNTSKSTTVEDEVSGDDFGRGNSTAELGTCCSNEWPSSQALDPEEGARPSGEMSPTEALQLFTKIPFPEPRRVIHLRPRVLV